jgi:hypothetical protein
MKKNTFSIIAAVLFAGAAHAQLPVVSGGGAQEPAIAAAHPSHGKFRLSMSDGNGEVAAWDFAIVAGVPAVLSNIQGRPYEKDCGFDAAGKMIITPDTVNSGLEFFATAWQGRNDEVAVKINLSYITLKAITRQTTQRGCSIELPVTHGQSVASHIVNLRAGEMAVLPSLPGDEYRFMLQRL